MDFLLFIVVVTVLGSSKIGVLGALLFALLLGIGGLFLFPLSVMLLVGLVSRFVVPLVNKNYKYKDALLSAEGMKRTRLLQNICNIASYILLIAGLLVYKHGELAVAGFAGLAIYFIVSFLWGDLPFQKPRNSA